MSTQIDWQGELDRAIEHVPGPPAAAYVASGRHAVRRRRATQAAAGLGTAAVLTALAWAAVPGGWTADGSRDRESQVATGGA